MPEEEEGLAKELKDENVRKVFQRVFDRQTIGTIHSLAMKGNFKHLEFLVSEGKEALVFRAVDDSGSFKAVKVYKITASTFKNMLPYIQGDPRFKKVRNEKTDIVMAWCRKEFRNLEECAKAKVSAPLPNVFLQNALVMEFIGDKEGNAAPVLKTIVSELDWWDVYRQVVENFARMVFKAKLVHADLSEFNMLYQGGRIVFIDLGQAVSLQHPKAREFLDRDLKNIARFFSKKGVQKSAEEIKEDLRKLKAKELS